MDLKTSEQTAAAPPHVAPHASPLVGASLPLGQRPATALRRDALHRWMLVAADVLAAALALTVSTVVLGDDALAPTALLTLPFVVLVCKLVGLYDRDEHLLRRTTLEEGSSLFRVATLFALLMGFGERFFIMGHLGRDQVVALWALMFASMVIARTGARRASRWFGPPERCLVLGDAEAARLVCRSIEATDLVRAGIVGRVPLEPEPDAEDGPAVLGAVGMLDAALREHHVDRVVIAPGPANTDATLEAIGTVKAMGVDVSVLPRLVEIVDAAVEFDEIDGLILLGVRGDGLSRSSRLVKRSLDVVGALALLVLLAPLMAVIAVALRRSGPDPLLVRTPCVGYRGRRFTRLDFRGSSLSALPQLINVLRGEMSLVGPRPRAPDARAEDTDCGLDLFPGVTGAWRLGPAPLTPSEAIKSDYGYGVNWSLWLDLRILLRTGALTPLWRRRR